MVVVGIFASVVFEKRSTGLDRATEIDARGRCASVVTLEKHKYLSLEHTRIFNILTTFWKKYCVTYRNILRSFSMYDVRNEVKNSRKTMLEHYDEKIRFLKKLKKLIDA